MKLIALCGAAGAGKDTVADLLPARKLAFADTLYCEVAEAWGVEQHVLRCRETKESPTPALTVNACPDDDDFVEFALNEHCHSTAIPWVNEPRSPRQILQWWGDYRRAQDPDYFVNAIAQHIANGLGPLVITDVRFPNEAALMSRLGGQLWQIRRPGYAAGGTGHASDTDGSEFGPDRVLENFGSLDDLRRTGLDAWEYCG